jgi:hypothetical protein
MTMAINEYIPQPDWWANCDGEGCNKTFPSDYGEGGAAYDDREDLVEELNEEGWEVNDDDCLCRSCAAKQVAAQKPEATP